MNKTVQKVRSISGSVLYFIATLTFTVYSVLTMVGSSTIANEIERQLAGFAGGHETLGQMVDGLGGIIASLPVAAIVFGAINLLVSVGMWLNFISCHSKAVPPSTGGMTLIRVMLVINLIIVLLSVIVCVSIVGYIAYLVVVLMSGEGAIPSIFFIVGGAVLAVIVLALIMTVLYYNGIFRTIKAVKMTIHTGVIMGKISVYVIVVNYIAAAILLTGAVLSPDIIVLVGGVCGAVSYVTCSVTMGTLRSEMQYIAAKGSSAIE